jgi:hypothetical protein
LPVAPDGVGFCGAGLQRGELGVTVRPRNHDLEYTVAVGLERVVMAVAAADHLGEKHPNSGDYAFAAVLHVQQRDRDLTVVGQSALVAAGLQRQAARRQRLDCRDQAVFEIPSVFQFDAFAESWNRHILFRFLLSGRVSRVESATVMGQ